MSVSLSSGIHKVPVTNQVALIIYEVLDLKEGSNVEIDYHKEPTIVCFLE